jgi:hypothetical protein
MLTTTIFKKRNWVKIIFNKFSLCLFLSSFAALGVLSYAYHFSHYLGISNQFLASSLGALCALCAMLANTMLGTYSLLTIKTSRSEKSDLKILGLSTLGSIPYGFLCYSGYQNILPATINIVISVIVVVVNAGIGYTAIKNVLISVKSKKNKKKVSVYEYFIRGLGLLVGLIVSVTMYLATCHGVNELLIAYHLSSLVHYKVGFIFALISWLPIAVLFANANQTVAGELYQKCKHPKKLIQSTRIISMGIILFCLFSGAAIAQMMDESFDPAKKIPTIFTNE